MDKKSQSTMSAFHTRPPVVAVLGHVDHGKTSLLDAIRKTSVALREHGGITQSIGAFMVDCSEILVHGKAKHKATHNEPITNNYITFIDTPGHAAFARMRFRGVTAADVGILVVAADDGVMPQTREAISHIKEAKIPFVVALTKSDLQAANPEKVKQQLVKEGVALEGLGGDVPAVLVSAKTGKGLADLLEVILLVSQMHDVVGDPKGTFKGVIIEAKRDRRKGVLATVIVRNGALSVGDEIIAEDTVGKIKALITDSGVHIKEALPGSPVEVLGFSEVPKVGSRVMRKGEVTPRSHIELAKRYENEPEKPRLALILKTDTQGSLEAIMQNMPKEDLNILLSATGDPSAADILLAKASNALVVGFNTSVSPSVLKLAETEGVIVKIYKLIYELLEELEEVIALFKEGKPKEVILGKAKVHAVFPFDKKKVAGCKVIEGRIVKGDKVRVERGDQILGEGRVVSVRVGKDEVNKVETLSECGILLSAPLDFEPSDMILSVR